MEESPQDQVTRTFPTPSRGLLKKKFTIFKYNEVTSFYINNLENENRSPHNFENMNFFFLTSEMIEDF